MPVGDHMTRLPIVLNSYDLAAAERQLCTAALTAAGGIVPAAQLLGVPRHALKRRMIKHCMCPGLIDATFTSSATARLYNPEPPCMARGGHRVAAARAVEPRHVGQQSRSPVASSGRPRRG